MVLLISAVAGSGGVYEERVSASVGGGERSERIVSRAGRVCQPMTTPRVSEPVAIRRLRRTRRKMERRRGGCEAPACWMMTGSCGIVLCSLLDVVDVLVGVNFVRRKMLMALACCFVVRLASSRGRSSEGCAKGMVVRKYVQEGRKIVGKVLKKEAGRDSSWREIFGLH